MGPSPEEEAALLAEEQAGEPAPALPGGSKPAALGTESGPPLPPLDELVARIPAPTRELLDELFRARFLTVRRIPVSALKH